MVKPQSSKLITRVRFPSSPPLRRLRRKRRGLLRSGDDGNRFRAKIYSLARSGFSPSSPSSPRDLGSRRFRVEALSFSFEGMTGIPFACGFVSSRARNPHAPARHPLQIVTSLWIQRFPGFPGSVRGGGRFRCSGVVFGVLGPGSPRVVEALLVVADWAFEVASQWVLWPVEGGSVKWCPSRHAPARPEAQPPIGVSLVRGSYKSGSSRRLEIK